MKSDETRHGVIHEKRGRTCLFYGCIILAILAVPTHRASCQEVAVDAAMLTTWLREHYPQYSRRQVRQSREAVVSTLREFHSPRPLTTEEVNEIMRYTPAFMQRELPQDIRVPAEINIFRERYSLAIHDYLTRPRLSCQETELARAQLENALSLIGEGIERIASSGMDENTAEKLRSIHRQLADTRRKAAACSLTRVFKKPLAREQERLLHERIKKATDEVIGLLSNMSPEGVLYHIEQEGHQIPVKMPIEVIPIHAATILHNPVKFEFPSPVSERLKELFDLAARQTEEIREEELRKFVERHKRQVRKIEIQERLRGWRLVWRRIFGR